MNKGTVVYGGMNTKMNLDIVNDIDIVLYRLGLVFPLIVCMYVWPRPHNRTNLGLVPRFKIL